MEWLTEHGGSILLLVGTFVTLLLLVGVGVLAAIWIGRGLRRVAETQLSIDKVKQEQSAVRSATRGDQTGPLRAEVKELEAKLRESTALAKAREKLLAAEDENLSARAKALAAMEKELAAAKRHASESEQRARLAEQAGQQAQAELDQLRAAHVQLEQAAGMMQRQMDGQAQNAAMLQSTVADLNAKRDLLTAEVRHLQERLEQESALRLAVKR